VTIITLLDGWFRVIAKLKKISEVVRKVCWCF